MRYVAVAVVLAVGLISIASSSSAASCPKWKDWLGFCSAAEVGGEAAKEASRNVYATFNFWAKLIEDYHVGKPEDKEKARQILKGVFGFPESPIGTFEWQIRVSFKGVSEANSPLRVIVLTDYQERTPEQLRDDIKKGVRVDFNVQELRGTVPPSPSDPTNIATKRV